MERQHCFELFFHYYLNCFDYRETLFTLKSKITAAFQRHQRPSYDGGKYSEINGIGCVIGLNFESPHSYIQFEFVLFA